MLTRSDAVYRYQQMADRLGSRNNTRKRMLEKLPPHLIQRLLLDGTVGWPASEEAAFSGDPTANIYWCKSKLGFVGLLSRYSLAGLSKGLELGGHQELGDLENATKNTLEALSWLEATDPDRAQKVYDWTSLIAWVELSPGSMKTLLTSSTFPRLPHCTFISMKAQSHIPPNSVLIGSESSYALRENLYHEALHQELSSLLTLEDVLHSRYESSSAPRIPVPWRSSDWEPDRVLHAVYVYSHLLPMRIEEATSDHVDAHEKRWLDGSVDAGAKALKYLFSELTRVKKNLFSKSGEHLLAKVAHLTETALSAG